MRTTSYVIARDTNLPFGQALEKARALLQGVHYSIKAKVEEKFGIEREPYVILDAEPDLGAFLPRNVVVYEREGRTRVAVVEPGTMLSVVSNEEPGPIAERVRKDLARVVDELARG